MDSSIKWGLKEMTGRDYIGSASCGSASSTCCSADSETPRSRTGLGTGISFCSKATDRRSRSLRLETATGTDLLRVMISKSLNFILIVTVRPRLPAPSQYRQTLSMSGLSSTTMASKSVRSVENVFSAPTDLRIRSARTSRLSTPREPVVVASGLPEVCLVPAAGIPAGRRGRLERLVGAGPAGQVSADRLVSDAPCARTARAHEFERLATHVEAG